jgi:eukaryotic-like serine/threonine-protein kinase
MHSSGTVEWEANHPDCEVLQQPTANEQRLPFVWRISQGDTPAFSAGDAVTVDVLNFHGTDGCELELHAIEDGRGISFATVPTDGEPAVLDTYGASPTYVADTTCSFRITAGR